MFEQFEVTQPKPGTVVRAQTGGLITYTKTGLVHTSKKAYGGTAEKADEDDAL